MFGWGCLININTDNNIQKQNEVKIIIEVIEAHAPYFSPFGVDFIENNKDNCEIIINGKKGFNLNCFGKYNNETTPGTGIFEI